MTPAKKKKKAAAKKPPPQPRQVPIPANAVGVPAPVLTPTQRKLFSVVTKKDAIGFVLFMVGLGLIYGFVRSDKEHLHDIVVLIIGCVMALVGALMMDLTNMGRALKELATTAKDVLPFTRKADPPPPPAGGGGV